MKDYYSILGVDKNSSKEDIGKAYRKLAREYHPDLNKDKDAVGKFKEISEAYEILGDEEKRQAYDSPVSNFGNFNNFNPFSFFFEESARRHNLNVNIILNVSLKESINGCNKTISFPKQEKCKNCVDGIKSFDSCDVCNGTGKVQVQARNNWLVQTGCQDCRGTGKKNIIGCNCENGWKVEGQESLEISIPIGVETNSIMRLVGKGIKFGQHSGDLNIKINVEPHQNVARSGNDLIYRIWCPAHIMLFGGKIELCLFDSKFEVNIPAKTQSSSKIRLKSQGIKGGDLFIIVNLDVNSLEEFLQPIQEDQLKLIDFSN